jgi:hypothetical protein
VRLPGQTANSLESTESRSEKGARLVEDDTAALRDFQTGSERVNESGKGFQPRSPGQFRASRRRIRRHDFIGGQGSKTQDHLRETLVTNPRAQGFPRFPAAHRIEETPG